jgi:hypothetical protein
LLPAPLANGVDIKRRRKSDTIIAKKVLSELEGKERPWRARVSGEQTGNADLYPGDVTRDALAVAIR